MQAIFPDAAEANRPAPWDLSRTPNYAQALPIDTVAADELTEEQFYRRYVSQNRPCHIVGAVNHWAAFKNWPSIAYLKRTVNNDTVPARSAPLWEHPIDDARAQQQAHERNASIFESMPFHDFLERASAHSEQLVVHSVPLRAGLPLEGLLKDLGTFPFLPKLGKARIYPPVRAFFYRNSYTDWHYHPVGETLMTQVVGDKEVLLLAPDAQAWDTLSPIASQKGYLYDIDQSAHPRMAALRPYRVQVKAGDTLYIPVYWWHAVASPDDGFGVTVAVTFNTPLHVNGDLRYPAARKLVKHLLRSRYAPLAVAGVTFSYLHRAGAALSRALRGKAAGA